MAHRGPFFVPCAGVRKGASMYVKGVPIGYLWQTADDIGVNIIELKGGRKKGSVQFRLGPIGDKYRRVSARGARIYAVCYHGYYEFIQRIYKLYSEAEVGTEREIYQSARDFEIKAPQVGGDKIGSKMIYRNACLCKEES